MLSPTAPPLSEDPDIVYELFHLYAEFDHGGRGGVRWGAMRQLMKELDLLEGIPPHLVDAYIREMMLRADQDQDGMLSCQEFMVWLFTEVAALLPFKHLGAEHLPTAPLYNRWLFHAQKPRSYTDLSHKVTGMSHHAFQAMAQHLGWWEDNTRMLRRCVSLASKRVVSDRTQGKLESGARMQFVQFVEALHDCASSKKESVETVLYKVVGNGSAPPVLPASQVANRTYRLTTLRSATRVLVEGPHELTWSARPCAQCGKDHSAWVSNDSYISSLKNLGVNDLEPCGGPLERPHLRSWRYVNTRNVRAMFHKYNLKYNKGLAPPAPPARGALVEPLLALTATASAALASPAAAGRKGPQLLTKMLTATAAELEEAVGRARSTLLLSSGGGAGGAGGAGQAEEGPRGVGDEVAVDRDPWVESEGFENCCCLYKKIGLMELQTFIKLCHDNAHIWEHLQSRQRVTPHPVLAPKSPLTEKRVEAAFMTACSIAGAYCSDTGCGIHDKRIPSSDKQPVASRAPASTLRPQHYGTPFDGGATRRSTTQHKVMRGYMKPSPTSVLLATLRPEPPAATAASPQGQISGGPKHRAAVPTLNFLQFLEAIRLVAEDIQGSPSCLRCVEFHVMAILSALVHLGCPLEQHQSLVDLLPPRGNTRLGCCCCGDAGGGAGRPELPFGGSQPRACSPSTEARMTAKFANSFGANRVWS